MEYHLQSPLSKDALAQLRIGDRVLLSGTLYTARDAAHQRMLALLEKGEPLPFSLQDACIYYAGPTPPRPGDVVGSIGPTTAGRMDNATPALLRHGLAAMIGKGARNAEVLHTMQETGAVYFGFTGGAGALAAACVTRCELVAWEDLGSEAVRRLTVQGFPLVVLSDSVGGNLYAEGPAAYLQQVAKLQTP